MHERQIQTIQVVLRFRAASNHRNQTPTWGPRTESTWSSLYEGLIWHVSLPEQIFLGVDREVYSPYLPSATYLILPTYLSLLPSLS